MMSANTAESNAEFSSNNTTSAKHAKKGKKRKRVKQSPEEQHKIESTDKFNKLHHACSKHLHREAKVVKSFECQKIVRAIKVAKDSISAQTQQEEEDKGKKEVKNSSKAMKRLEALQLKLDRTKKMDLDVLVQVGLKRLGVLGLDPRDAEDDADESDKKAPGTKNSQRGNSDAKESSQSEDPFYQALLESMLQHKRLSTALDQLNEKVTEHRQWTMRREAMLRGDDSAHDMPTGSKKKKKQRNHQGNRASGDDTMIVAGGFKSRNRGLDLGGHEGASGLFIGSLSGIPADGYSGGDGEEYYMDGSGDYEEGDYYEHQQEKKKNRPGQRARRAKAMAIEAKKAGKTWDSSLNWREKKKERSEEEYGRGQSRAHGEEKSGAHKSNSRGAKGRSNEKGDGGTTPKEAQHIATMGKVWKEEGNAHPSWAAKAAAQKSQGIAKFAGTKITFD